MEPKSKQLLNEVLCLDTSLTKWKQIIYSIILEEIRFHLNDSNANLSRIESCIKITSDILSENIVANKQPQKISARQIWLNRLSDLWTGDILSVVWGWCIYLFSPIAIVVYKRKRSGNNNYVNTYSDKIECVIDALVESFTLYYKDFAKSQIIAEELQTIIRKNKDCNHREIDLMLFLQQNYTDLDKSDLEKQFLARFLKHSDYEFREYNDTDSERFNIIPQYVSSPKTTVPAIVRKADNLTISTGIYVTPIK